MSALIISHCAEIYTGIVEKWVYLLNSMTEFVGIWGETTNKEKLKDKFGLSPSKKICVICFIESPLKMMKNAFLSS